MVCPAGIGHRSGYQHRSFYCRIPLHGQGICHALGGLHLLLSIGNGAGAKLTQPEISSTPAAAAAAGALLGIGGALVIIGNGSQGGFDIIAIIRNKKWNLPIAAVVNGIDALLTLLQVIHASAVQIIGALPLVAMCGVTMNFLIVQCRAKHLPRTEPKKV